MKAFVVSDTRWKIHLNHQLPAISQQLAAPNY